ncbi:MAG: holo-ACP synthase [Acidobacteriota bacterium]
MIKGVGIDTVEVERMAALLAKNPERTRARLFTAGEQERCDARTRPDECYAARFAAKEAFLKAVGTGLSDGVQWTDVEVVASPKRNPELLLSGRAAEVLVATGASVAHLSFTHEGGSATAIVLLEG